MNTPLAERLRPQTLEDLVGADALGHQPENLVSMILWGPPGCGKTSFARIVAKQSGLPRFALSAVTSNTSQFREVFARAEHGERIVLLVDEIHHLNKSQQDIFLPHLENGNIILLGTTTENPSFELRSALLSRCKVLVFKRLTSEQLMQLLKRAGNLLSHALPLTDAAQQALCEMVDGDARYLLNCVETLLASDPDHPLAPGELASVLHTRLATYDKHADAHYNLISALHKSIRGSDPDAALYWLSRMLQGGENPLYILRRLVRCAVEDIGLSDPQAVVQALAAQQTYSFLGSPEGELAIAQAVVYLATAPKSNAVYKALSSAQKCAQKHGSLPPPKHILNAPTELMREQGYSDGYIYDHDTQDAFSGQNYFPDNVTPQTFYAPVARGFERQIQERIAWWKQRRAALQKHNNASK